MEAALLRSAGAVATQPDSSAPARVLIWSPRTEMVRGLKSALRGKGLRVIRAGRSIAGALDEARQPGFRLGDKLATRIGYLESFDFGCLR